MKFGQQKGPFFKDPSVFQYRFGDLPVLHDTIIAHIPISVYGSGVPIFSTTCAKVMPLRQIVLAAVSDGTIIAHNSFSVIGNLLPKFFTTFDRENAIWLQFLTIR